MKPEDIKVLAAAHRYAVAHRYFLYAALHHPECQESWEPCSECRGIYDQLEKTRDELEEVAKDLAEGDG